MPQKTKKPIKKSPLKASIQPFRPGSEKIRKTKVRVIGIGGGGGNIVSEIASRMTKASFVVANTDTKALKISGRKVSRFQFGQNLTQGLGTGMNPELGEAAALQDKDKIKKLLEGQDLCILVACLGGGTGSGAAPVFVKTSKNLGNITYGIFTLPFKFEGEKKMEIARESLRKIKSHLNAFSIIPNERAFQIIDKATPLKQALSVVNKSLSESLEGLIETIYEPGLINIDFADLRTILEGRGKLAYLNTVEVQRKEGSTKELMTRVLNSPLYPYTIRGAKGVLFNIAGEKKISLAEVSQISKTISELANPQAKIIFGVAESKKYSDVIKTILLAVGCGGTKIFSGEAKEKKVVAKPILKKRQPSKRRKRNKKPSQPAPKKKTLQRVQGGESRRTIKIKVEAVKEPKEKESSGSEAPKEGIFSSISLAAEKSSNEERVRKNALQIKRESEDAEREMLEKEKIWETPAFLRKKLIKGQ